MKPEVRFVVMGVYRGRGGGGGLLRAFLFGEGRVAHGYVEVYEVFFCNKGTDRTSHQRRGGARGDERGGAFV